MSYVPAPSFSPSSVYAGWHQHLRLPFLLLGFSAAYFLAAKVGIATSMPPQGIVILWPPNAIVLAALLAVGRERWLLFFIATVATEVAADVPSYPLWAAIGYGVVNFSEAALAAALLLKINRGESSLRGVRDFIRFLIVGPLFASGMAALLGAAIYKIGAPDINYLHYWRVFWLGDALGLLTIGTTLLAWHRPAPAHRLKPARLVEAVVLSAGLLAVSGWALLGNAEVQSVYLIFPLLIWAALRFGVRGASIAIIAVAAVAIGTAVWGQGLFAHFSQVHAVVALQGLIAAVALSTFMLAFSVETSARATLQLQQSLHGQRATEVELREAYRRLEQTNTELDRTIAERTRHLRQTIDRNETLLKGATSSR